MAFEMTEQVRRRLTQDTLVWLTTVTPSGRPAPRLVWFLWTDGGALNYSHPGAAKLRHIVANDRVTLNFNSDALGSDAVVFAGRAELASDAPLALGNVREPAEIRPKLQISAHRHSAVRSRLLPQPPERPRASV